MIFSCFENIFKEPTSAITLTRLAKLVGEGHTEDQCDEIQRLRKAGDKKYKQLKRELLAVTPQCHLRKKSLDTDEHFKQNFIDFSTYLYFDLDFPAGTDVLEQKQRFIEKHHNILSLTCISSSMGGIAALVRLDRKFSSKEEFEAARRWIIHTAFPDEKYIDHKCNNLNRFMFVPYDKDVYANLDAKVELPDLDTLKKFSDAPKEYFGISRAAGAPKKTNKKKLRKKAFGYDEREEPERIPAVPLKHIENIDSSLRERNSTWKNNRIPLKLKTEIKVDDPWFEVREEEVVHVRLNDNLTILDSEKHDAYYAIISKLLYLNPQHPNQVFDMMRWINFRYASPPMDFNRLKDIFLYSYNELKAGKRYKAGIMVKRSIHFNEKAPLKKEEKIRIANKINGELRTLEKYQTIKAQIAEMEEQNIKITVRSVATYCKVCKDTASKYIKGVVPDPKAIEKEIKEDLYKRKGECLR